MGLIPGTTYRIVLVYRYAIQSNRASKMKKSEMESKTSVEMFEGRSMLFLTTVHIIFTILLFVAMTHVQIQMTSHIAQQERENKELREILSDYKYTSSKNGRKGAEENNHLSIEDRNKPQHNTGESKVRDCIWYKYNREATSKIIPNKFSLMSIGNG